MVSYEKIKEYKEVKKNELMASKKYNDFLDVIEKELYKQINEDPLRLAVYIEIPKELNTDLIIERLTDEYDYQAVKHPDRTRTIIIKL